MKTILIEEVANGWLVRGQEESVIKFSNGVLHVYQNLKDLQADLPNLLAPEPYALCPPPDDIARAREKAIGSAGSGLL